MPLDQPEGQFAEITAEDREWVCRCYIEGYIKEMQTSERYRMEVKHRWSIPKRYTWEIHDGSKVLSIVESPVGFSSWEEASNAGKIALAAFQVGSANERKPRA